MKNAILVFCLSIGIFLNGQDLSNCNVIEWTLDDINDYWSHIASGYSYESSLKPLIVVVYQIVVVQVIAY